MLPRCAVGQFADVQCLVYASLRLRESFALRLCRGLERVSLETGFEAASRSFGATKASRQWLRR